MSVKGLLILIGSTLSMLCAGQVPFTAEMLDVKRGSETIYQLRCDGNKYRYDFEQGGMKGIVIVNPVNGKSAILMPDEKYVHFADITSRTSLSNDPYQSFLYMKKTYDEKKSGREKIEGYDCNISEIYASERKLSTAWYSEELGFILKMVNNNTDDTYMLLRNIKKGNVDKDLFEIPGDYTEVDERMRPIIPEPPPPESWNSIELNLPIMGDFKRGDNISFKIPESTRYKVMLKNNSDDPSKIIRISMRDGKELDDNEQGPLSYRTKRIHGGESSSDTYIWTAGDQKIFKIYEGVINIEIIPENK